MGLILNDASSYYDVAWWLMLFPGGFLIITTLASTFSETACGTPSMCGPSDEQPSDTSTPRGWKLTRTG